MTSVTITRTAVSTPGCTSSVNLHTRKTSAQFVRCSAALYEIMSSSGLITKKRAACTLRECAEQSFFSQCWLDWPGAHWVIAYDLRNRRQGENREA